jgi:hypothetical protein
MWLVSALVRKGENKAIESNKWCTGNEVQNESSFQEEYWIGIAFSSQLSFTTTAILKRHHMLA